MAVDMPKERINPKALKAWRVNGVISFIIFMVFPVGFFIASHNLGPFPLIIGWVLLGLALVGGILQIFIIPRIRMWYWRYEIRDNEIDIQYGIIVIKRTLIPMIRIQHVDTEQGPVLRYFKLSTLSISTAGTTHKIPALSVEKALELRSQVSMLARMSDEDV